MLTRKQKNYRHSFRQHVQTCSYMDALTTCKRWRDEEDDNKEKRGVVAAQYIYIFPVAGW